MSAVEKISGRLALGAVQHGQAADFYGFMRVGSIHLKRVKIVGELAPLLRDGEICTVWVARVKVPTPLFFSTVTSVIYAIEVEGTLYKAVEETRRYWNGSRAWQAFMLAIAGFPTMFLVGLGLLLWINAVRLMVGSGLPVEKMRGEPA
ncbi:hypothetical protein [Azospira sp. I09]|jgi:hypothetical protein|uniref:hypothetical protein n=1 Tax=Azospira sp. I09 TaxID=1765049 RepID=UPI0012609A40|nr:hypothetical protein [Azospira sp. I09]BBN88858.1 hypothetical protein AZSP09_18810 [Azospira sp. I09]